MGKVVMEQGGPRLLRDKSIKHYRLFPFELRRIQETRKVRAQDGTETEEVEELYEFSICSDAPVERYDWWTDERFTEVLSLEPGDLETDYLDAGASVLLNHRVGQLVGRTKGWSIDGEKKGKRKVRAKMKWSPLDAPQSWGSPQGVKAEVDAEVRGFTSVGYEVLGWEQTRKGDPTKGELNEYTIKSRIFEWSFVDIPADISVGDGRSRARFRGLAGYDDGRPVTEERKAMGDENRGAPAANGAGTGGTVTVTVDHVAEERKRVSGIMELARVHKRQDLQEAAIAGSITVDQFRAQILEKYAEGTAAGRPAGPRERTIEIPKKIRERFSFCRAALGWLAQREQGIAWTGPERDVHDEFVRRLPVGAPRQNGFMVPLIVDNEAYLERQERAMDSKTGGKGAELVFEQPSSEIIELLVPRTRLLSMGAQVLTGLGAPIPFVKQTGDMSFAWVGENPGSGVAASDLAYGLAHLAPKSIMGKGTFSRQLLQLSNPSIELLFRRAMSNGHARAIDKAGIHGKGAAGEPLGIYNTPGVSTQAMGGVPTYGKLVDMTTDPLDKNASDGSNAGFITTPKMAGKLKQVAVLAAAGAEMCWMGKPLDGLLVGERATSTNQVSKTMSTLEETGGSQHGIVYSSDYAELIFGSFAALEVTLDPFTLGDYAMLVIRSFGMEDLLIKHGESFSVSTGATLT